MENKKVALIILDGFGMTAEQKGNAVFQSKTPTLNSIFSQTSPLLLGASSEQVGLPFGEVGNSEVGHLTLGAGRVIEQDFTQINNKIEDKTFFSNKIFLEVLAHIKKNNSNLHIVGLLTESGVHAHLSHLFALLDLAKQNQIDKVYLHLFTDGRDSPEKSAKIYFEKLQRKINEIGVGKIVTVCGRFFGMDRDKNWDRTKEAYELITMLKGERVNDVFEAIAKNYQDKRNDENIEPFVLPDAQPFTNGDGLIIFNFRSDRAIQIAQALTSNDFKGFSRKLAENFKAVIFTEYNYDIDAQVAFTCFDLFDKNKNPLNNCLAEVISGRGLSQLHAAETEKFAHITYFFNGSKREEFKGEERLIVPSAKVKTFDLKPEMSASELADKFIQLVIAKKHQFLALNFANPDMVGHSGNLPATIRAIEIIDQQIKKIYEKLKGEYEFIITSDHGNADELMMENGQISKEHSVNPVPYLYFSEIDLQKMVSNEIKLEVASNDPSGILADIAPTILSLMGITKPEEMTGESLV
ncbi:MAG: 2,3-bisphosphoglycerate-independent phosphoglycerate mutase [Candidatus Berkelbacteria bacterium Licking1014_7]|uniref:2,3-bisphosphoglycerate-independent phosphoglycerate mutase n=1 Tax=Candidatus Berkelbacteria bacterium Licking1014_7 TaxID=2017147 RepID=A0A554LHV3_9BACT|nr:MAG: 2,3-bisphosphoglycerate-independent phosphoglycerate mutase [Candidatus Berkelbacteria bacterium Licking1014_7]